MDALVRYHWPGDIREMQNVIERAVILSRGPAPLSFSLSEFKQQARVALADFPRGSFHFRRGGAIGRQLMFQTYPKGELT
jgi:DNA-binding NtrC family response regulator